MYATHNFQQINMEQENMHAFQNAISSFRLDLAKETVEKSNDADVKELTIDIVSNAKKLDIEAKNSIADIVEAWSINLKSTIWTEELKDFCMEYSDIQSAYSVIFLQKRQFIIVVDDMAKDSVLEYNMFAFELRNKHTEINDFMVIDEEAFGHIKNEFDVCNEVYKRG